MPRMGLAAVVFEPLRAASGIFEDQDAVVAEWDLIGLPGGNLVERVGLRLGWGSRLVESVQVWVVVGNALAAFRRRTMKTRFGGGSCRRHGQSGASAIHSLTASTVALLGLHQGRRTATTSTTRRRAAGLGRGGGADPLPEDGEAGRRKGLGMPAARPGGDAD